MALAIRIQRPFPLATSPARADPALKVALYLPGLSVATLRADKQEIVRSRFETFPGKFASCRGRRTRGEPVASVWWFFVSTEIASDRIDILAEARCETAEMLLIEQLTSKKRSGSACILIPRALYDRIDLLHFFLVIELPPPFF